MKKISLSEYKNPIRYFRFLAILIKEKNKNIDDFFYDELDKTPSSFWKALNGNVRLSTANNLLKIICDYFGYKIPTDEVIDELEEILNKVYYSIYYKLTTNFEEELILLNKFGVLSEIKLIQGDIDFQYEINNSSSLTENKDTDVYENPVDLKMAISFYVNKIQILKKLAELSDEELELFPKFLMNVRINNIENYLKIVKFSITNYFQK